MDFYTALDHKAYQVDRLKWFEMPRKDGSSAMVITVPTEESPYWVVAITLLISSIFMAIGYLTTGLVLTYFPLRNQGNRYAMLVSYYNSDSPYSVIANMYCYAVRGIFNSRRHNGNTRAVNWNTVSGALFLAAIAASNIIGNTVTRFFIGGNNNLIVRYASRANPNAIFYPNMSEYMNEPHAYERILPVIVAEAYQALGRIESAKSNLQTAVKLVSVTASGTDGPTLDLNYSYSITGADMGLQLSPKLVYGVSGRCRTEYNWLNTSQDAIDVYPLWHDPDDSHWAYAWVHDQKESPVSISALSELSVGNTPGPRGLEFALIPGSSHRRTNTSNSVDPWYLTEDEPGYDNGTSNPFGNVTKFRVRRGRPPLRCWQNDTWTLGNEAVFKVADLSNLTGLRLSKFIQDVVFHNEFTEPPSIYLANVLRSAWTDSILSSAIASNTMTSELSSSAISSNTINAGLCNTTKDVERLIHLSFLYSREVVRNVAVFYPYQVSTSSKFNAAVSPESGKVPYESADFILDNDGVAALSVKILLIIPCISIFLWILVWIGAARNRGGSMTTNKDRVSRHNMRSIGLLAPQLYRALDEHLSGKQRWHGRKGLTPYIPEIQEDVSDGEERGDTLPAATSKADDLAQPDEAIKRSRHIKPKLRGIPGSEAVQSDKRPFWRRLLLFWESDQTGDHLELVMTREWRRDLK